ncbi:conjugative transfer protein MobI(A/C) [Pseudomonas shirazica]|uniref:conjugative transfer protein MobI(A/C) n=1 Tax=Pseudomonas shirazica TaxID=1940636 RepID=UPI001C25DDE2|nr:conjugative transfer protein MobI(A/C) [Pseudomonas shirazica]
MNPPSEAPKHPAVAELDRVYSCLVDRAEELRDSFFQAALSLHAGKPGHIPIVIRIRQSSPNAVTIEWAKVILPRFKEGEAKKPRVIRTINKGKGSKYPVSSFSFVKEPLKSMVRAYEIQLAEIRETCSGIQRVRRQLVPAVRKAGTVDSSIAAFITHDYPAAKD